jgi:hypothetical protein
LIRNRPIALLSHRFGNIGHLFMAVGFEEILYATFGRATQIEHFEQHHFFSVYPRLHWLKLLDLVPHGRLGRLRLFLNRPDICERLWPSAKDLSRFSGAIACGGPSIVRGVGRTPEMCLMFHHQLGAFNFHGVPTFDCGLGSGGFPLRESQLDYANAFDEVDKAYFKRLFSQTTVSTVRDVVAQRLLEALGRQTHLIPCGAIASGRRFESLAQPDSDHASRHIVVNYQRMGANSDWGQGVDVVRWQHTVQELIQRLGKRHKVVFLCHSQAESQQAAAVSPDVPRLLPTNLQEYATVIRNAKAGIASRIHAAIPMAGIGLPVTAIGTDTRLGTLELIGLKAHFVDAARADELEHQVESDLANAAEERHRLIELREATIRKYGEIFSAHLRV